MQIFSNEDDSITWEENLKMWFFIKIKFQMWLWGLYRVTEWGQSKTFKEQDQRLQSLGLSLLDSAVQQGSYSHCLRTFMGTQTTCLWWIWVQERILGITKNMQENSKIFNTLLSIGFTQTMSRLCNLTSWSHSQFIWIGSSFELWSWRSCLPSKIMFLGKLRKISCLKCVEICFKTFYFSAWRENASEKAEIGNQIQTKEGRLFQRSTRSRQRILCFIVCCPSQCPAIISLYLVWRPSWIQTKEHAASGCLLISLNVVFLLNPKSLRD